MQRFLFGTEQCQDLPVNYYLLSELTADETEVYGIQVEYRDESVALPAITTSQKQIESLLAAMRQGGVTPTTARDVVEDWLVDSSCNPQ